MKSMNVTIPDPMKEWVKIQIDSGQYASASDYVRDLIRQDQRRADRHQLLVEALIEGEESSFGNWTKEEIIAESRADM